MKIQMRNSMGLTQEVKIGFSWTTFFFGFFPALLRGDLKWATIIFVLSLIAGVLTFGVGAWIPGIVFSFVYNKIFCKGLIEKGYLPTNREDELLLKKAGIFGGVTPRVEAE